MVSKTNQAVATACVFAEVRDLEKFLILNITNFTKRKYAERTEFYYVVLIFMPTHSEN